MKFLHLADLHLGKSIYGVSLIDNGDQIFWARRFLEKAAALKPDAVVIAGDVYDRSAPSGDAVMLLNYILTELEQMDIPVMLIAGNHDSGQRLSFAGSILAKRRIYIAGSVDAEITHVTVPEKNGSGEVTFWLVPYLFPAAAAQKLGDDSIGDYETAMRKLLERQGIDFSKRNVLVAHQNVTAGGREAGRGGSESMAGGVGQMDYRVFDGFDYVALGHLHGPQQIGRKEVRYGGTLLKYSFSEIHHHKSVTLVELGEKGQVAIKTFPVKPLHEMRQVRGSYEEITRRSNYEHTDTQDYMRIILTDEEDIFDAVGKLRAIYPNLMRVEYDNTRTAGAKNLQMPAPEQEKGPAELVEELFEMQNHKPMEEAQKVYMERLIRQVWEEKI